MTINQGHPKKKIKTHFLNELHKYIERDKLMKRTPLKRNTMDFETKKLYFKQQTVRNTLNLGNFRHVTDTLIREAGLSMEDFSKAIGYKEEELELFIRKGILTRALHDAILKYFEIDPHDSLWERYMND